MARPLDRTTENEEDHLDYLLSKYSLGSLLKSKVMTRAFLGYIREAKEEETVVLEAQGNLVVNPTGISLYLQMCMPS